MVERKLAWGDDRVFLHDGDGKYFSIPTKWTDAAPPDPFLEISNGKSTVRIEDMLALSQLMRMITEGMRQENERSE